MGGAMQKNLARNTQRRWEARAEAKAVQSIFMAESDKSKTGTLSRDEVKDWANSLLTDKTPALGGLTEEEIDMLMRVGGDNCAPELKAEDLPVALAVLMEVRDKNRHFYEMFMKFDTDNTGVLKVDQLRALLEELAGVRIAEGDVKYILTQCQPLGAEDPIPMDQLKAAIACWYCLATPLHEKIKTMFQAWDSGNTGVITLDEMNAVMAHMKAPVTGDEVALLFQSVDANHNGTVEYNEFVDWVLAGGVPLGAGVEEEAKPAAAPADADPSKKKVSWSSGLYLVVQAISQRFGEGGLG